MLLFIKDNIFKDEQFTRRREGE